MIIIPLLHLMLRRWPSRPLALFVHGYTYLNVVMIVGTLLMRWVRL